MKIGIKGDTSFTVTKEMLASQDGDDTLEVFSTPTKVFVHTELIDISENGKFLTFKAEVSNEKGIIGTGTHVRAIVNKKRFMEKLRAAVSEG